MIVPNVMLAHRLTTTNTGPFINLTRHAKDWSRSTRAIGGYWTGDFTITPNTMGRQQMVHFYNTYIGYRILESTAGIQTWDGEIVQMDLTLDGKTDRRTLDIESWHNKIKVTYTDSATSAATSTAYSENTDSSDRYGESVYIDVVDENYNSTAATAARDRRLNEKAFPKSLPVTGFASGPGRPGRNRLVVRCAGYVYSINRRLRESDTAAAAVSTQVSTLVGESEFVTAGDIDTNAMSVPISCADVPERLWDIIEDMILMGDTSGNRWVGGVYNGRRFDYKQAETAVTHYWKNRRLQNASGVAMTPSLIRPDIIVAVMGSAFGETPPGGNVWDSPRRVYIEEVEFTMPNKYRLIPYEASDIILEGELMSMAEEGYGERGPSGIGFREDAE